MAWRPALAILVLWLISAEQVAGQTPPAAAQPAFRRHVLNQDSQFSAAGAMDVNGDGRVDIVCGAWWYEAPTWTQHLFRDIPQIRGRYDDYSNLTLDIDGDGWPDIVSVNYRSQSLYWVRHPGTAAATDQASRDPLRGRWWENFTIDRPGKSETGRLVDIDGDGQLDILPAGTDFAAWYEFRKSPSGVQWLRHDLPDQLIGHGIGTGDLSGDGRLDVIGTTGWAEAPADPRTGKWQWHPDFRLARDCSIPILCWDVDGDGDLDLVWGRGHGIGLYWTEQLGPQQLSLTLSDSLAPDHPAIAAIATSQWVTHPIDTSWGAAHSLLLADIDGDGRDDLIAGKRYQGHDGKDPGENDPLVIYWYQFEPVERTWRRQLISFGGGCGIDLDTVCVDLDNDGDVDIIAPSRAGLHWLENRRIAPEPAPVADSLPRAITPTYPDRYDLSYYLDDQGSRQSIAGPLDHGIRRQHILDQLQQVMGPLPEPSARIPLDVQVRAIDVGQGYWRIHLTYAADHWHGQVDRVPAFLLLPMQLDEPAPAMLCLHQTHFELGKSEPCGMGGNPNLHFAHELAQRGYVCLAPDYPGFSEYRYSFEDRADQYASGTMKGIWNHLRAVDLLEMLPCVRRDAIGVIGHSLGGHNALFVAAFDQRLRCVVTSCGFNSFADYYQGDLTGWTSPRYMPRIATQFDRSPARVPFDFPEILAAIAPRPIFVNAPTRDGNFAVLGVHKCEAAVRPLYQLLAADNRLRFEYPEAEHDFPPLQRQQAYRWLDTVLR